MKAVLAPLALLVVFVLAPSAQAEHRSKRTRPIESNKKTALLRDYFAKQEELLSSKVQSWEKKILSVLDKDLSLLRTAIEEFLIEDQMFLEEHEERAAFGKPLKEFSKAERDELVREFTLRQKKLREKLIHQLSDKLIQSSNPKAHTVGEALQDIKKDHLEAYDKVVEEIEKGTLETTTTHCFTCGRDEEIGKTGYTFGGAMEEAAARVAARFADSPKTKAEVLPSEKSTPNPIGRPVMQGSRATGKGRAAFEAHMNILRSDPALSDETLRRFLKAGPYGSQNPGYRTQIDRMSRDEMLKAISKFLEGKGPYNHCPSCNLGAGKRL